MNSGISYSIGNMPTCGSSQIQNTSPRLGGQSIGQTLGLVMGALPSADNWGRRLALDLRYVDLLRETGTDILWDDAGWYDKWGTWNGPEWRKTNDYLRKHDMKWVLWYPDLSGHAGVQSRTAAPGLDDPGPANS